MIELNFCKLNHNLRRYIITRGEIDFNEELIINEKLEKIEYILDEEKDDQNEDSNSDSIY